MGDKEKIEKRWWERGQSRKASEIKRRKKGYVSSERKKKERLERLRREKEEERKA